MRIRNRVFRVVTAILALVCASVGVVAVADAPAQAANSCWGDYCSGKNPAATQAPDGHYCSEDGRTIQSTDIYSIGGALTLGPVSANVGGDRLGTIELRWSSRCKTNWARLNIAQGVMKVNTIGIRQTTGYEQVADFGVLGQLLPPGVYWTNMIYSPTLYCQAFMHKDLAWWYATNWD